MIGGGKETWGMPEAACWLGVPAGNHVLVDPAVAAGAGNAEGASPGAMPGVKAAGAQLESAPCQLLLGAESE